MGADRRRFSVVWTTPPTVTPTEFHSAHYPALFHEIRLRDGSTNPTQREFRRFIKVGPSQSAV